MLLLNEPFSLFSSFALGKVGGSEEPQPAVGRQQIFCTLDFSMGMPVITGLQVENSTHMQTTTHAWFRSGPTCRTGCPSGDHLLQLLCPIALVQPIAPCKLQQLLCS